MRFQAFRRGPIYIFYILILLSFADNAVSAIQDIAIGIGWEGSEFGPHFIEGPAYKCSSPFMNIEIEGDGRLAIGFSAIYSTSSDLSYENKVELKFFRITINTKIYIFKSKMGPYLGLSLAAGRYSEKHISWTGHSYKTRDGGVIPGILAGVSFMRGKYFFFDTGVFLDTFIYAGVYAKANFYIWKNKTGSQKSYE